MLDFSQVTDILLGNTPVEQVSDSRGNVLWSSAPVVLPNYFYVEDISGSDNTLSITKNNASAPTIEVFKSSDCTNWTSMGQTDTTAITATIPANGKLYLKATSNNWGSEYNYNIITASGNHNVGGSIMSLLYDDIFEGQTTLPNNRYNFNCLFSNNNKLINANKLELPATTLVGYCYQNMFDSCTSLTTAPTLPATTLGWGCYRKMFFNCTSLTTAPVLPATTLKPNCYSGMFNRCTSLVTAPVLPATTLVERCYNEMFDNCINLNSVISYADDISASGCLSNWVRNVSSTGDFYNLGGATYTSGASGIPSGWTEHNSL